MSITKIIYTRSTHRITVKYDGVELAVIDGKPEMKERDWHRGLPERVQWLRVDEIAQEVKMAEEAVNKALEHSVKKVGM